MNKAMGIAAYILGAATGAVVTWIYAKGKYEEILEKEIASVKDVYLAKREEECSEEADEEDPEHECDSADVDEHEVQNYARIYTSQTDIPKEVNVYEDHESEHDAEIDAPYVIPPEEFGEFDDYGQRSLVYYADLTLADDEGYLIEDVDRVVGYDSLTHFGEYEDDSVHVRNDRLKCDYEILLDTRTHAEALKSKAYYQEV